MSREREELLRMKQERDALREELRGRDEKERKIREEKKYKEDFPRIEKSGNERGGAWKAAELPPLLPYRGRQKMKDQFREMTENHKELKKNDQPRREELRGPRTPPPTRRRGGMEREQRFQDHYKRY